ncbi:hypothetical protein QTG54_009331 [Skeletonema marinoi]|uniref:Neurotransmitter-gated ion-channel ligand-binding domain-containing protein n=1 Tax=Skeletonema marinoi TaxID=267567 RepID=A0AAD9DAK0_9STRA|nr:hypothetical protein QTG54_009331 [Skeletonema marinoi]
MGMGRRLSLVKRPSYANMNNSCAQSLVNHVNSDVAEFSDRYDNDAPPVGLDMAGHDTFLMGPKAVILDSFIVDLLHVDTSAQTFRLKLLLNMDWEDDGTIEPEVKYKRGLGRKGISSRSDDSVVSESVIHTTARTLKSMGSGIENTYKTGKYVLKKDYIEDPLGTTWNPEVVLVNAVGDEDPIEAGSKLHSIAMLGGRPVITRSMLYQPECRCKFSFANFPFDETELVVKFSSNKWNSEQVNFLWSERLNSIGRESWGGNLTSSVRLKKEKSYLKRSVDNNAVGGVGLSEFEIVKVRVESDEKDVNSMQRYDNAEGAFSEAHLIITVRRDPYSYLLRVGSVGELLMILEVLSFFGSPDLSDRFSISGTIFLALVSLYGPMADALPKVSVVTRVDKWNLYNFSLLFASNVENLLAFMVQGYISEGLLHFIEVCLGMVYLAAVLFNLYWFLKPLADREEFDAMSRWIEKRVDHVVDVAMKPFLGVKRSYYRLKLKIGFSEAEPTSSTSSPSAIAKWRKGALAAIFARKGAASETEEKTNDNGPSPSRVKFKRDDPFENRKSI